MKIKNRCDPSCDVTQNTRRNEGERAVFVCGKFETDVIQDKKCKSELT